MLKELLISALSAIPAAQAQQPEITPPPPAAVNFTVPEPLSPTCIMRVELVGRDGAALSPEQEKNALRTLAERCRLIAPYSAAPRLVRREDGVYLHLYCPLQLRPGEKASTLLQFRLNRSPRTFFLPVHPRNEQLLQRADVISIVSRYELEITTWMESNRSTPPPLLPHLPDSGDTKGYKLVEQAATDDRGTPFYNYLIVRAPEVLRAENLLISNEDVAHAEICIKSISVNDEATERETVSVRLQDAAAARLHKLTLPLAAESGRIAVVSDDSALAAPRILAPLSGELILAEVDSVDLIFSLLPPMPCEVRLEEVQPLRESDTPADQSQDPA